MNNILDKIIHDDGPISFKGETIFRYDNFCHDNFRNINDDDIEKVLFLVTKDNIGELTFNFKILKLNRKL